MKRPLFPALSAAIALSGCFHSLGNTPDAGQLTAATSAAPLRFAVSSAPTGDGGSGFGILAEYADGGPRRVVVTRRTAYDNPADIQPDYFRGWGSLCSLRVYDPDGYLAAIVEMGVQTERERTWTLDVPAGKAGVWRVSVSGGFRPAGRTPGDEFDIDKLRYHKIILMSDADADGSHIQILWTSFIWRYMPDIINNGYLLPFESFQSVVINDPAGNNMAGSRVYLIIFHQCIKEADGLPGHIDSSIIFIQDRLYSIFMTIDNT